MTVTQATEAQLGGAEVATDTETLTGSSDALMITPDKMNHKLGTQTNHGVAIGATLTSALAWTAALTNGQLLIGSTNADPVAASITSTDGSIAITAGAGTLDLSGGGSGLTYAEEIGATKTIVVNYEYGANRVGGVAFALPATAAAGTRFAITGIAGLWSITQGASQYILLGDTSTTVGAGGSLTATNLGDCIRCTCIVANTVWRATSGWTEQITIV